MTDRDDRFKASVAIGENVAKIGTALAKRVEHLTRENADLNAMLKAVNIDALIATQLRRSIERNSRLVIALQQIADIAEGSTTANSLPHIAKIARGTIKGAHDE